MKRRYFLLAALALVSAGGLGFAAPAGDLHQLAQRAVSPDQAVADQAIAELRERGPEGLEALFEVHKQKISEAVSLRPTTTGQDDPVWDRISAALNAVGGQYDCHASRLYWHTDFEKAKAVSKSSGKPILTLRMLGQLTDECSCANSRFFRTVLYANGQISKVLREQYVLHWKSVRPVPHVTIDFGDGRVLRRTLTGNSIHYVLDSQGRFVDALPGLYGPQAFLRNLNESGQLARNMAALGNNARVTQLRAYHLRKHTSATSSWRNDLAKLGVNVASASPTFPPDDRARAYIPPNGPRRNGQPNGAFPAAARAALVARGKGRVEVPILRAAQLGNPALEWGKAAKELAGALEKATTEELWRKMAALHASDARLDGGSVRLMMEHNPNAMKAAAVAPTKAFVETPIIRLVSRFQKSIALDTVRNEYLYRRAIHQWIAFDGAAVLDLEAFNKRVYADLFLTPDADPWLGLAPEDTYTGLRENGEVSRK